MSDQDSAVAPKPAEKPFDISILFAVCGVLFSILVFLFMSKQERETAIQQFHTEMAGYVADLQYHLNKPLQSVELMQASLLTDQPIASLSSQAEALLNRSPALTAILMISPDAEPQRWVAKGRAVSAENNALETVIQQLLSAETAQSAVVSSADGSTLVHALEAAEDKRLIVLLGINRLVSESALAALPEGVGFSILDTEGETIYNRAIGVVAADSVASQMFKGGIPWSVTYAADDDYLASRTSYMPAMFLLMGLLLSFMVASYLKKQTRSLTQLREQQEVLSQQVVDSTWNDPVTGVANRTHFDESLDIECRRAVREFSPMTMMALEIDHFPEYIGCYGEQAAELALQQVAKALSGCVTRPGDLLARIDNHQFGLILPSTNEMATYLASRCCEAVSNLQIPHDASSVSEVMTISIGLVTLQPSKYLTPERLYEAACEQLLHAQNNGGNQYIAFAEHGLEPSVTYSV